MPVSEVDPRNLIGVRFRDANNVEYQIVEIENPNPLNPALPPLSVIVENPQGRSSARFNQIASCDLV